MDNLAGDPDGRAEIFNETAVRRGLSAIIIEKDFWVCWTLDKLFTNSSDRPSLLFKGGTSLSKVFAAIERFSEDIDLSINRHALGFENEKDPACAPSGNKAKKLLQELDRAKTEYIRSSLLPELETQFRERLPDHPEWSLTLSESNPDHILFAYPTVKLETESSAEGYVNTKVKLEFGARSDHWPAQTHIIRPYAAESFPDQFERGSTSVKTLDAERTFWEKVTILHAKFHEDKATMFRESRHYYDVHMLANTEIHSNALAQPKLLEAVAEHKSLFFRSAKARYDLAKPGTLKLVPHDELKSLLERDYAQMEEMFFQKPPSFDEVVRTLEALEREINEMS